MHRKLGGRHEETQRGGNGIAREGRSLGQQWWKHPFYPRLPSSSSSCFLCLFLNLPSPAAPPSTSSCFLSLSLSLSLCLSLLLSCPCDSSFPLPLWFSDSFSTVASLYEAPLRRWKQNNSSGPELHNGSGPFFSPIAHFSAHCSRRPRQRESERDGQMHADSRRKGEKKKIGRRERKRKEKERGE